MQIRVIRVIRGKRKVLLYGRDFVQRTLLCYPFDIAQGRQASARRWKSTAFSAQAFLRLRSGRRLEAVYQAALAHELTLRGIPFEVQRRLLVTYKGQIAGEYVADPSTALRTGPSTALRTGFVVDDKIILELKAVSTLLPKHEAQAHNYLAATGLRLAILLNPSTALRTGFGAESLQQERVVK